MRYRCDQCRFWQRGYTLQGMKVPSFCTKHFHSQHGDDPACRQFEHIDDRFDLVPGKAADTLQSQAAEIARLREALASIANTINVVGSPLEAAQQALDRVACETKGRVRAALAQQGGDDA